MMKRIIYPVVIIILFLIALSLSGWAEEEKAQEPIKLPEVVIIGEDTTVLKEEKEKLQPQEIWYGLEKERPDIKQELEFLEITPVVKDTPQEKRPGWFYRNAITAQIMKLLAGEKAYYKIGLHKFQKGDFTPAIKAWDTLLDKYPQGRYRGEALYWLGEAYSSRGEQDQALKADEELIRIYPQHRYTPYAYLSAGWIFLEKKDYSSAEKAFAFLTTHVPSINPTLASLGYYLHGSALYSLNKFGDASQSFKELREKLSAGPLADEALFWQAECLYYARDYPNALKLYQEYWQKYPANPLAEQALYGIGWCRVNSRDFAKALASWEQLEKHFAQSHFQGSVLTGKIRAHLGMHDLPKAEALLTAYQTQHPATDPWLDKALFEIGVYQIEQKNFPRAIQILNQILKDYPNSTLKPLVTFLLAEDHYQLKEYLKAVEYYRQLKGFKALQLDQKALLRIGLSYYQAADYERAAQALEDYLQQFPDSPFIDEANFWLAESRFQQEEFSRALKAYGAISPEGQKADYALYGKAWVLYRIEKWKEATPLFQQLIEKFPKSALLPEALFRLGECYFNLKEYDQAYNFFQRLLQEFPQNNLRDAALFQLGWISYKKEDYPGTRKAFEELLARSPSGEWSDDAQYWYGMSYFLEKNYAVARNELKRVTINYPKSPFAFRASMSLGDSYYNEKDYKQALKAYQEIITNYPSDPQIAEAEYVIIQTVLQQGQEKRFSDLSQKFLTRYTYHPLSMTLMFQMAEQELAGGDTAGARKILQDIIGKFHQNPEADKAFFQIAELDFQAKDYAPALQTYHILLKSYPTSSLRPVVQFKTAQACFYLKEYQKASYGFERFIAEFPEHHLVPQALYYIGASLYSSGQKDKAAAYFQKVVVSFPQDIYSFKSYLELGKISSEDKQHVKAQELFAKAAAGPDREVCAQAHFHLADSYTTTGEFQKGIEEYLKVAYLYPDQKELSYEALLKTAQNYEQLQRWPEALSIYQKVIKEGKEPGRKELVKKKIAEIKERLETKKSP